MLHPKCAVIISGVYLCVNHSFRKVGLVLGLAAMALAVGTGCGPQNSEPTASTSGSTGSTPAGKKLKVAIVFDSGGRGDKSFNDSADRGLDRAAKELGVEVLKVDSRSEKDYEGNLTGAADQKADLVIAVGINMMSAVQKAAPEYPDTKFAIIDAGVEAPNVRSLLFTEHEGSFLVGYLAGLMTKSNKLGFVGGQDLPLIKKFEVGYEAGAKMANTKVEVLPAKYTGDWNNIDVAKSAAGILIGQGADIVYHAAGRAGLGVIKAAKEGGKYAIGVDSDQDEIEKGTVLTSMIKRVDEAVFQTIQDLKDGKFAAGSKVYDLKAGGVGTSEFTYTKDKIGSANLDKLKMIEERIKSGDIKVPQTKEELAAFKPAP